MTSCLAEPPSYRATALKVLVVDLPDVPVVWRVVLFMGLGALLIGVSYAVPGLLRGRPDAPSADRSNAVGGPGDAP